MPWWAWIVLSAVLLIAEMVVSTDFYLVVLAGAAAAVGLVRVAGYNGPVWSEWLFFGLFAAAFLVLFRRLWPRVADRNAPADTIVGEVAVAQEPIGTDEVGRAELRGTTWSARNISDGRIDEGDRVRVVAIDGLTIHVEKEARAAR